MNQENKHPHKGGKESRHMRDPHDREHGKSAGGDLESGGNKYKDKEGNIHPTHTPDAQHNRH